MEISKCVLTLRLLAQSWHVALRLVCGGDYCRHSSNNWWHNGLLLQFHGELLTFNRISIFRVYIFPQVSWTQWVCTYRGGISERRRVHKWINFRHMEMGGMDKPLLGWYPFDHTLNPWHNSKENLNSVSSVKKKLLDLLIKRERESVKSSSIESDITSKWICVKLHLFKFDWTTPKKVERFFSPFSSSRSQS